MSEPVQPVLPTVAQLGKHALLYGGAAGVLSVAWSLVEIHLGDSVTGGVQLWLITLARLAFPIGGITLGIVYWRDRVMGGSMRFVQAMGAGLAIGLVFALVQGLFMGAFSSANPEFIEKMITRFEAEQLSSGMEEAQVEEGVAALRDRVTPFSLGIATVAQWMFGSVVISLIGALFVRKRVGLPPSDA